MKKSHKEVINTMRDTTITINNEIYFLTPWFGRNDDTTPSYKGTYQVLDRATTNVYYAIWTGKIWTYKDNSIDWIYDPKIVGQPEKNPPWRGIIKPE